MASDIPEVLDARIAQWRSYVSGLRGADQARVNEVEQQLIATASSLTAAGLDGDESFLVALRRVSSEDGPTRAFLHSRADELAIPSVTTPSPSSDRGSAATFKVMLACAAGAAMAVKLPAAFGIGFDDPGNEIYVLNISLFVLPFLLVFLAWLRRPSKRRVFAVAGIMAAAAVLVNLYPFDVGGSTHILTAIHLPILLWLAVGVLYTGEDERSATSRMDYVKFTGEWFITYVLIALGGGVLSGITMGMFGAIGLDAEIFVSEWLIPCGAMAAVLVAAWLVETRRGLVGGIAPLLARVFTPLFAVMLVASLIGVVWAKGFVDVEREVLILFDVLLVVVLAMLMYAISSRDPQARPDHFDRIQLVLVIGALAVDMFAQASIGARLGEWGVSANKAAALGLNLILLVELAGSAWLQIGFLKGRRDFGQLVTWHMRYLPVYAIWAAIVVLIFPIAFNFA